jgi:endonuclease-3
MSIVKKQKVKTIVDILSKIFDDKPALEFSTPYELLIAVILSAQCTDERVNKVTAELFKKYNTPQKMITLSQEELEKYIFSCGFYRMKAEHILSASRDIIARFNGEVPQTVEELITLAGVGKKTANVVYSVAFGGDAIAVDTHVFRVSNRLGLAKGKTPIKVEEGLQKVIPKEDWSSAHHWLIWHGRKVCHSQRPDCANCTLACVCDYVKK